jgi:hypothetical protein
MALEKRRVETTTLDTIFKQLGPVERPTLVNAKVVSHGRYVAFQMAEVAIPRQMLQEILRLIAELRPQPPPAPA